MRITFKLFFVTVLTYAAGLIIKLLRLRFRKAGRVWCGGARETREPHDKIGRTVSKRETTQNLHAFQDLSGSN